MDTQAQDDPRDFAVFGSNVRSQRQSLGWRFAEFAERAGICKDTLARIQRGAPCSFRTQQKIAKAFNIRIDTLWLKNLAVTSSLFHFKDDNTRWYFAKTADAVKWPMNESPERTDPESIQDSAERSRLGKSGLSHGFTRHFRSHLPGGYHWGLICEVYARDEMVFLPNATGACFYGIRGQTRFFIGSEELILSEGEVLVYDLSTPCVYEPVEPLGPKYMPPLFFCSVLTMGPPTSQKAI